MTRDAAFVSVLWRVPDRHFGGTRTGAATACHGAHLLLGLRISDVREIGGSGMAVLLWTTALSRSMVCRGVLRKLTAWAQLAR
jgi:hypothetical protein